MSNRLLKKMVLGWKDKRLIRSTCHDDVGLTKHLKGTLEPCPPGPLGAVRPGNGVQWSGPQSHAVTPRCQRLTEQNPKGHSLPSRDTALSTRILAGRGQIKLSTGRPGHSGPTPRDTSWTIQTNSSCEETHFPGVCRGGGCTSDEEHRCEVGHKYDHAPQSWWQNHQQFLYWYDHQHLSTT